MRRLVPRAFAASLVLLATASAAARAEGPVVEIDGRKVGAGVPGPLTKRLTADFHSLVRR